MAQLRDDHHLFCEQDTELVVVGPDNAGAFRSYWTKKRLPFLGLPDPKHTVLKQYGQEVNLFKLGRMPAQVIIDKQGMVRYVHYGHAISDIPDNQELLAMLKGINHTNGDGSRSSQENGVAVVN